MSVWYIQFTVDNRKAQKYLMTAFEMLVGEREELMSRVPHILKSFYDLDIIEEDALLEWADKVCGVVCVWCSVCVGSV